MYIFIIITLIVLGFIYTLGFLWGKYCRDEYGMYDPLYKCWFDYSELDSEQLNRVIPNCNHLMSPKEGQYKRIPFWKEEAPIWLKVLRFVFYGRKPKPYNIK